jgi:hypothetical protein
MLALEQGCHHGIGSAHKLGPRLPKHEQQKTTKDENG